MQRFYSLSNRKTGRLQRDSVFYLSFDYETVKEDMKLVLGEQAVVHFSYDSWLFVVVVIVFVVCFCVCAFRKLAGEH